MLRKVCLTMASVAALSALVISTAGAADKLKVTDTAGTKTFFNVTDTGVAMINTGTFDAQPYVKLQVAMEGNNGAFSLDSYASSSTQPSVLGSGGMFRYARGTQASKQAVQTGDRLGFFLFSGYDGGPDVINNYKNAAGITAKVDGTVSLGNVPTKFAFETGQPSRVERMAILSNGIVGIGLPSTATPADTFVSGAAANGKLYMAGDTMRLATPRTPASATEACNQGEISWDANYVYVCVAANTWKRTALSSW